MEKREAPVRRHSLEREEKNNDKNHDPSSKDNEVVESEKDRQPANHDETKSRKSEKKEPKKSTKGKKPKDEELVSVAFRFAFVLFWGECLAKTKNHHWKNGAGRDA